MGDLHPPLAGYLMDRPTLPSGWLSCQAWFVSTDGAGDSIRRQDSEPVVIGGQMAAARAAEARHQAEPHRRSPLAGVAYDPAAGELNLLHLAGTPKDELIDEFVDRFAASSVEERALQRSSLTMRDFYAVLNYARRAAVRALRSNDDELARRGVAALSVIDENRIDWRDLAWQAGLLSYAIHRTSGNVTEAFETAASLADGETATLLNGFSHQPVDSLGEWGFREIQLSDGIGLIEDGGKPYRPRSDLVGVAEAVAAGMAGDFWQLSEPMTGSDLPTVWLSAETSEDLESAIRSITGCVSLRGSPRDPEVAHARAQHMLVFLAETEVSQAAGVIAAAAGPGTGSSFAALGVAARSQCAVVIARSLVQDTPSFETQASLERFRRVLVDALAI
jgi:hypothetical protein